MLSIDRNRPSAAGAAYARRSAGKVERKNRNSMVVGRRIVVKILDPETKMCVLEESWICVHLRECVKL